MHLRQNNQQFYMRGRVLAQGITFALMAGAASTGYFKKEGRPKTIEDVLTEAEKK